MMNNVIIMRGAPGSGKTSYVKNNFPLAYVCSADHYMLDLNGNYKFDPNKLDYAHKNCYFKFLNALEGQYPLVILDNTNIKYVWFKNYIISANNFAYQTKIIRLICDPNLAYERQKHGVSLEKIKSANQSLINQKLLENEIVIT